MFMPAHRPASKTAVGGYLVTGLLKQVQAKNIPVFNNTLVTKLLQYDEKQITGVEVTTEEGKKTIHAKAVLLAAISGLRFIIYSRVGLPPAESLFWV